MAAGVKKIICANTKGATCGNMCRSMMRRREAPSATLASTNWPEFSCNTIEPYQYRQPRPAERHPSSRMISKRFEPNTKTMKIRIGRSGMLATTSASRCYRRVHPAAQVPAGDAQGRPRRRRQRRRQQADEQRHREAEEEPHRQVPAQRVRPHQPKDRTSQHHGHGVQRVPFVGGHNLHHELVGPRQDTEAELLARNRHAEAGLVLQAAQVALRQVHPVAIVVELRQRPPRRLVGADQQAERGLVVPRHRGRLAGPRPRWNVAVERDRAPVRPPHRERDQGEACQRTRCWRARAKRSWAVRCIRSPRASGSAAPWSRRPARSRLAPWP